MIPSNRSSMFQVVVFEKDNKHVHSITLNDK